MDNFETLVGLLSWLLTPGAGAISYTLMELVPQLAALAPKPKRFVAMGLSGVIAVLAYLVMIAMQYKPTPEDWRMWVETLVGVALVASAFSEAIHGLRKL